MDEFEEHGEYEEYDAPIRDGIDLILETDAVLSITASDRYRRVASYRRDALSGTVYGVTREIAERSLRLELAAAMRITERAVDRVTFMAEALTERYPTLLASLAGARISERHADVFVDLVDTLEPDLRGLVVDEAVALAEALPMGSFRAQLRTLIDGLRAPTLEQRHTDALADRRIAVEPAADGMAWLVTLMPAVEARAIFDRATRIAKVILAAPGETRTLNQVRSDVIADLCIDGHVDAHPEAARGIRAEVIVTVPAVSLLDDEHAKTQPATVEGVGPIPITRARELCGGQKEWMRVLTHPETGMILSVGRKKYRPPKSLRKLVAWRAGTCGGPGCLMPAHRGDIDHTIDWATGGHTELCNLGPFCDGHHTITHYGNWRVRQFDGGVIEWTSPTGRVYLVEPEHRIPTFTADRTDVRAPF